MQSKDNYYNFLVIKAQQGSKNTFLELVDVFKKEVYKRAIQLTCNTEHSKDITSEVFIKAWSHIKLLNEFTPFDLWLKGITVNLALTHFREIENLNKPLSSNLFDKLVINNKEEKDFVQLDGKTRELLILHDLEGYSLESYSEILNETDHNDLLNRLDHGRKALTSQKTIDVLNSFSDSQWSKFIADFDTWDLADKNEDEYTDRLILIKKYRDILDGLLSENYPKEHSLDKLKNTLVKEGEEIVKQKEKELSEKRKKVEKFVPIKTKKKNYIDEVVKIFTEPDAKEKLSLSLKEKKQKRKKIKNYFWLTSVLGLIILGYFFLNTSTYPWQIDTESKNYLVNDNRNEEKINLGDIVKTENGGKAKISIENKSFMLFANSAFLSLEDLEGEPHLAFQYGSAEFFGSNNLGFNVEVGNVIIKDYGAVYKLNVNTHGIGQVNVQKGQIKIIKDGYKIPVWQNHTFKLDFNFPYRTSLPEQIVELLLEVKVPVESSDSLVKLLNVLEEKDALTLWSLLVRANETAKNQIFNKLEYFFPLPENVTKEGIIENNSIMMDAWLKSIEWQIKM